MSGGWRWGAPCNLLRLTVEQPNDRQRVGRRERARGGPWGAAVRSTRGGVGPRAARNSGAPEARGPTPTSSATDEREAAPPEPRCHGRRERRARPDPATGASRPAPAPQSPAQRSGPSGSRPRNQNPSAPARVRTSPAKRPPRAENSRSAGFPRGCPTRPGRGKATLGHVGATLLTAYRQRSGPEAGIPRCSVGHDDGRSVGIPGAGGWAFQRARNHAGIGWVTRVRSSTRAFRRPQHHWSHRDEERPTQPHQRSVCRDFEQDRHDEGGLTLLSR